MKAGSVIAIERTVDRLSSGLFALACGYATYARFAADLPQPELGGATAAAAALAYLLGFLVLNAIQPKARRLPVPIFDVREVEPMDMPELLLTDRHEPALQSAQEPLLLDDVLEQLDPASRVVRLFDAASMPTAGELKSRIDRHLDGQVSPAQAADAAQALHDALAELRRSLR
jgi:hypothetical protein